MTDNGRLLSTTLVIIVIGYCLYWYRGFGPGDVGSEEIIESEIIDHIRFLSDDKRAGRYPGTRESKDVISYLIKQFKSFGVSPGGTNNSYTQSFSVMDGIELGANNQLMIEDESLEIENDYIPLWFSGNGNLSADVVFAGYGFDIKNDSLIWNDYNALDVDGKWVMLMRHSPERDNPHSIYAPYAELHKKMVVARDRGAAGILYISQIEDSTLLPLRFHPGYSKAGVPAIHLSNEIADELLGSIGRSRRQIQAKMNRSLTPVTFYIPNLIISASVELKSVYIRAANVLGKVTSRNHRYRDEYIVVGAHFDHLGYGGPGTGSRKPDTTAIHNGADDNGSGTAGILELAHKLQSNRQLLKRSVLLIGFDAEEKGILGAKYFVDNPTIELSKIVTMINMDMIGRITDSTVTVGGVGTAPIFADLLDSLSKNSQITIKQDPAGYGPSDHSAFYTKDIPVLFFFSGFHGDYHLPEDDWQHINARGEKQILDIAYEVITHISRATDRPVFTMAGPKNPVGGLRRGGFKVSLGIMPSYGGQDNGLKVDGISKPHGPAAKAGIQRGDIIKAMDGKPVKDIYEFMDRMSEFKKGQTVIVIIDRDGKEKELSVTF